MDMCMIFVLVLRNNYRSNPAMFPLYYYVIRWLPVTSKSLSFLLWQLK